MQNKVLIVFFFKSVMFSVSHLDVDSNSWLCFTPERHARGDNPYSQAKNFFASSPPGCTINYERNALCTY